MTKATLRQSQYQEWLESLELVPPAAGSEGTHDKSSLRDLICDGVVLCHLVNKIKPGSVETVSRFLCFQCMHHTNTLTLVERVYPLANLFLSQNYRVLIELKFAHTGLLAYKRATKVGPTCLFVLVEIPPSVSAAEAI